MRAFALPLLVTLALSHADPAAAQTPVDLTDATARSILVEIDEDITDFTSLGGLYGPRLLASFTSDGTTATVIVPGPSVEARFATQFAGFITPVAGSFSDYAFELDVSTGDVLSATVSGSVTAALLGTLDIDQTASSSEIAGFMLQNFQGFDFPFYCVSGATCTLVPGVPYDPATGVARAVGRVGTGLLEFMTPFADIRLSEAIPPTCDIAFVGDDAVPGEAVEATLAVRHAGTDPVSIEMKLYLDSAASGPLSFVNIGSDGTVILDESTDIVYPAATILTVDATTPLGAITLGCRLLDPITGALIFEQTDTLEIKDVR
ncbi:MAG: hypothetical protein QNK05_24080 [Myxococcota bacterium]|nr:hypothetical protein [Myxococcota bacterium]